ncbi:ATP-binding protein [Streptomyces sp. HNM0574]|uniref:AAA family ATPase n=1 Tax=Streptomyces sp. HNM0574 TaxID=2714954 RepID=UPI00146D314A|nr:ATP-binding protein [Streptomyces sp. HNM0574]NLU65782.1 ATP-binding protein [Streptomyces sp. HNM0574]
MDDAQAVESSVVTELRLSAFRSLRSTTVPVAPVTLLSGPSGSGKSTVLEAYEALARLGCGEGLGEIFSGARGGAAAYVPRRARADRNGRRGFRLGCSVDGPEGLVHCDLSVQVEPELRIAGERLRDGDGRLLLATGQRDPRQRIVQAEWRTSASGCVVRGQLPDDRLATAMLPLRVAGRTREQRRVLASAEQVVVALRSVFACDPRPATMRDPVAAGDGLLRGGCDNVAAVLRRARRERPDRHARLIETLRAGLAGPVAELSADVAVEADDRGLVRAVLDRGRGRGRTPLEWLGDGELRYTALALVLIAGRGVLEPAPDEESQEEERPLTVLTDGLDRGLDLRQTGQLLTLAGRAGAHGSVRLMAAVSQPAAGLAPRGGPVTRAEAKVPRPRTGAVDGAGEPCGAPGVCLVDLGA